MPVAASMLQVRGTVAAPGLALGPLYFLDRDAPGGAPAGDDPLADFERALAAAIEEIASLMASTKDENAQSLLEFQIAMLEDETITAPAREGIARGQDAALAWQAAIEGQLAEFMDAEDPYFRARTADLEDMRERVLRCLAGRRHEPIPPGAIVVARDLVPSRFLETDWQGGGIVLRAGSTKSHVAMLARSRGVPMLIGTDDWEAGEHREALLDTETGQLIVSPSMEMREAFAVRRDQLRLEKSRETEILRRGAATRSGVAVKVMVNIADVDELLGLDPAHCDGIGLVRTELLLKSVSEVNNEDLQFAAYSRILRWAGGRPVTIRTLDAGSDKPIPGYTLDESNPFLGTRGVRLSLAKPEMFAVQLRALARAAAVGPLRVMVPMVSQSAELDAVATLMDEALADLARRGLDHRRPDLGMMVEVPAAAFTIEEFHAAFLSIGSNDLIQYLTAASRDLAHLAHLQEPLQPAVLRVIESVVRHANAKGIDVSLCGDMGAEPRCIPALVALGLRSVSVAPVALARIKAAIAAVA